MLFGVSDDESCRAASCLGEEYLVVLSTMGQDLWCGATHSEEGKVFVVGYTVGLFQLVYSEREVARGIDADGNGDGTALYKGHFEVVPIDDLKEMLEGVFEDKREIVGANGE